jgi:hypothetical protein
MPPRKGNSFPGGISCGRRHRMPTSGTTYPAASADVLVKHGIHGEGFRLLLAR